MFTHYRLLDKKSIPKHSFTWLYMLFLLKPPFPECVLDEDGNISNMNIENLLSIPIEATEHIEHHYALPPPETNRQSFRKGNVGVPAPYNA